MNEQKYDFCGWATRNDIRCTDGRTIRRDAFRDNDGRRVSLVWNHQYVGPEFVLGHADLENRPEGVYAYCKFNNTQSGRDAKELVKHGDVRSLSICANHLTQNGGDVIHGQIREVSLVLAGANPGAYIESVLAHSENGDTEEALYINYDAPDFEIMHADTDEKETEKMAAPEKKTEKMAAPEKKERTVQDVIDGMTEEERNVLYALVGTALENTTDEEDSDMSHNVFDQEEQNNDVLMHADFVRDVIRDAKRYGTMKESFLSHAEEYGIQNLEYLFPEDRNLDATPQFISRDMDWVQEVMSAVHHTPFSRVKSMFADITEDEARAKGYIKGKLKKEEVFSLLKRSTSPTTVYKKQKIDRDDEIDITDLNVLSWIKTEMRFMLNEELARAYLLGDGRLASDDDKIDEARIRPVVNDASLFVIRWGVAAGSADEDKAKNFIRAAIKARKSYKGSGNPVLYTTEDMLTEMLLLEDGIQHRLYKTEAELATALRVRKIVTVPVMEGFTDKYNKEVYGIIVNLSDYNVGADQGGAINMFDDFDIDYNQNKYLIETRCSGALTKPFSAIVLHAGNTTASEEPTLAEAKAELA